MIDLIKKILLDSSLRNTRLLIALSSLTWAILLWWSGDLFEASRKTYEIMALIADEQTWAAAFLFHSILAFYSFYEERVSLVTLIGDALIGCI